MKTIVLLVIILIITSSCSVNKSLDTIKLPEGTNIVKAKAKSEDNGERVYKLQVWQTLEKTDATIEFKDGEILIRVFDSENIDSIKTIVVNKDLDLKDESTYQIAYEYAYNTNLKEKIDTQYLYDLAKHKGDNYLIGERFNYLSSSFVFQAITIPFKFRPEIDDLSYEVTTGVNAGLAFGKKWTKSSVRPIYEKDYNMIAYYKNDISFSILPFCGLTTIKHEANNTDPSISSSRNIIGLNYGISGIFELNKLNVGFAYGFDVGLGEGKADWIYQNKKWYGVIIGLEFVK